MQLNSKRSYQLKRQYVCVSMKAMTITISYRKYTKENKKYQNISLQKKINETQKKESEEKRRTKRTI